MSFSLCQTTRMLSFRSHISPLDNAVRAWPFGPHFWVFFKKNLRELARAIEVLEAENYSNILIIDNPNLERYSY